MDRKYHYSSVGLAVGLLSALLVVPIYANSSWHWISETRPYDVLPYVIAMTLIIETAAVVLVGKVHRIGKVFCFISLANLLSFLAPYLLNWMIFSDEHIYPTYAYFLERIPVFPVGIGYLLITLAVELPLVYGMLKKDTERRKRLLWTIITANVITTILTYIVEHHYCYGRW